MYSEIYTTNLRAQSNILNGEKPESPLKPKNVKLLKQFPGKKNLLLGLKLNLNQEE